MTTLYTIGYEGSSLERFIAALAGAGVAHVLDIRRTPWSRKPGFAKKALQGHLEAAGIAYTHLVDLGTPSELRDLLKQDRDYAQFFAAYRAHLALQDEALAAAGAIAQAQPSALLCFERDPRECHRLAVAEELARRLPGCALAHLAVGDAPPAEEE